MSTFIVCVLLFILIVCVLFAGVTEEEETEE